MSTPTSSNLITARFTASDRRIACELIRSLERETTRHKNGAMVYKPQSAGNLPLIRYLLTIVATGRNPNESTNR